MPTGAMATLRGTLDSPPEVQRRVADRVGRALSKLQKKHVIEELLDQWERAPELRLGQLISNAIGKRDVFHVEDWEMVNHVIDFLDRTGR